MSYGQGNPTYNQPRPTGPAALEYENEWSHGICDCCADIKFCLIAWFFLPCFSCCVFSKANECALSGACCPINALRTKIRATYRIEGSIWKDVCVSGILPCCTLVQIANELKHQGIDI